jgi:hypothetical protein
MKFLFLHRALNYHFSYYWISQGILVLGFSYSVFLQTVNAQPSTQQQTQPSTQPSISPQVIKFKLNELSGVSEWIRAEVTGNKIQLIHTVVSPSGISKALGSLSPIPVHHTWYDHTTSRTIFRPLGCDRDDCLINGTNSISLPTGVDPYQGEFLLEYKESGWTRTVLFKLPTSNPSPPNQPQSNQQLSLISQSLVNEQAALY